MQKCFSILIVFLCQLIFSYGKAQTTITQWTFEESVFNTPSPVPTTGVGTAGAIGMNPSGKSSGSTTGCAQTSGTGAWQIDPATPGTNESNGVQFMVSTAGFENIIVSYDHRSSNTSARTSRIQYTLDGGTTWINLDLTGANYTSECPNRGGLDNGRIDAANPVGTNVSDSWGRRTVDFSAITGANDNPNFGIRIVAAHYSNTGQFRQANNVNNQATAGTWRFDNVAFKGTPKKCMLITEYMYSGINGEFVEFTNVCNLPIDMTGWSFDDDSRTPSSQDLSAFGIVQPGESVILTEANADIFRAAWGLCQGVKIIGGLTHNLGRNDEINLYDDQGNLVDRLTYGDVAFPGSIRTQNASGWVSPTGLGMNDPYAWTLSTVNDSEDSYASTGGDIGSPGKTSLVSTNFDPCDLGNCIFITEYMYSGSDGEFVEFTNVCNYDVDVTGWSFDDDSRIPGTIDLSAFGTIRAGESVILTESDAETFRAAWGLCSGVKILGNLTANLGRNDEINLYDSNDMLVDRLTYGDQNFPGSIRTQNAGGYVTADGLGANDPYEWNLSVVNDTENSFTSSGGDIGSPGVSTRATVSFSPCTAPDCIKITEYMYSGPNGEFVEFTNVCDYAVDMTGWSFDDDSRVPGSFDLSAFGIVEAGESVILTESDANTFKAAWNLCDEFKVIGNLSGGNNLGRNDEINLYDPNGNLMDRLSYGDQAFPGSIRTQNASGWVTTAGLGANDAYEWTLSTVDDDEDSYLSSGGAIGSPGKSKRAIVQYSPCDVVPAPCISVTGVVTTDETCMGTADGSITLTVVSDSTLQYAINGGAYQSSHVFENLTGGLYKVTVYAGEEEGCSATLKVLIRNNSPAVAPQIKELNIQALSQISLGNTEVVSFDPQSKRVFSTNGTASKVDIIDLSDPTNPTVVGAIPVVGDLNSVAVKNGIVAIAVGKGTDPGEVILADVDGNLLLSAGIPTGALPDMVTFTPDGNKILTANEGEPNPTYTIDPEGSVTIIDISNGVANYTVQTADFSAFNSQIDLLRSQGVRIFGPNATVAQDLEPEYITISEDGSTAYVSCQENNAIAIIDIVSATVTDIKPLGFKDHSLPENALDPGDKDSGINIQTWPLFGMYQPDALTSYTVNGQTYIISANEGDARAYPGYSEEFRVNQISFDNNIFYNANFLSLQENLGRLRISTALGDDNNDGKFECLYAYGARSFSIWNENISLVYDSGSDFERITSVQIPSLYNSELGLTSEFDQRSDNKGPEPEAAAVAKINGQYYAFIGLERTGGVMVYNVNDPQNPYFVYYIPAQTGDASPEDVKIIDAENSPNSKTLILAANEVSGTLSIYEIEPGCNTEIALCGNPQGGSGNFISHDWQITGGTAGGAALVDDDQTEATLDISSLSNSGTVEITYTVTDANGCTSSGIIEVVIQLGEIIVKGNNNTIENGSSIPSASNHTKFGSTKPNIPLTRTYTIENSGCSPIELLTPAIDIEGPYAGNFSLQSMPASTLLPGESTTFTIAFSAATIGLYDANVIIYSNAANSNPYSFAVSAAVSDGIMAVRGNAVPIPDGSTVVSSNDFTDFGTIVYSSYRNRQFGIFNLGTQALHLTGSPIIELLGPDADKFTVTTTPISTIQPGNHSLFTIRFDATEPGEFFATVSIGNSDLGADPYTFTIRANVNFPNISVRGNNQVIPNGSSGPSTTNFTDFGTRLVGSNTSRSFYVRNTGNGHLGLTGTPKAQLSGPDANQFTVTTQPVALIAPNQSSLLRIRYNPTTPGVHTATVSIESIDANNSPYTFTIEGNALATLSHPYVSEVVVSTHELHIYPNPTKDFLHIQTSSLDLDRISDVEIINNTGQLVRRIKFSDRSNTVNVEDLSAGAYNVRIVTENEVLTGTFIKIN